MYLAFCVWDLDFGVWDFEFWRLSVLVLVFWVWDLVFGVWRLSSVFRILILLHLAVDLEFRISGLEFCSFESSALGFSLGICSLVLGVWNV